jgi:hypothetical protein
VCGKQTMDRATRRTSDIATDASAAEHEDPRLDHGWASGTRPIAFHLILILIRFFGSAQIGSEWDDKDDATLSMDAVWLASTPMPG